jgi:hypothetical protein
MMDPSTVLAEEGPNLIRQSLEMGVTVVISHWFGEWLDGNRDVDPRPFVPPEDLDILNRQLDELRNSGLSAELRRFDHHDVDLSPEHSLVLEALLANDLPPAVVWADEWAYLQSHSWLMSKLRHPLDAFRDAGAVVVEWGEHKGMEMIAEVIPADRIPPTLTREIIGRATVKWIVVGGATIGGGTLGGYLGAHLGPVGAVIAKRAFARAGRTLSTAAVLAVDPD